MWGFSQREGIDFFETFSPCPSVASIRLLAAIACDLDWDFMHHDAQHAFIQSSLSEDLFIYLPKGCGRLSGTIVKLAPVLFEASFAHAALPCQATRCALPCRCLLELQQFSTAVRFFVFTP